MADDATSSRELGESAATEETSNTAEPEAGLAEHSTAAVTEVATIAGEVTADYDAEAPDDPTEPAKQRMVRRSAPPPMRRRGHDR